jgi:hypothetical protein
MSNKNGFSPRRKAAVRGLKAENKRLREEAEYNRGLAMSTQAQLAATRMERPPDLDDWIEAEVVPLMNKEEREEWFAQTPEEMEAFKDELGQRINAAKLLNEL